MCIAQYYNLLNTEYHNSIVIIRRKDYIFVSVFEVINNKTFDMIKSGENRVK